MMNSKRTNKALPLIISVVISISVLGCGEDGSTSSHLNSEVNGYTIYGAAEKGPFAEDSQVTVNTLTGSGRLTGGSTVTATTDNLGHFSFEAESRRIVQIVAEGRHYMELTGELSSRPVLLRAIYDVTTERNQTAHVNLLTHLIHDRVLKLLNTGGLSATQAIQQAQGELLHELDRVLPVTQIQNFTHLSLYEDDGTESNGNAYLLVFSSLFAQYLMDLSLQNQRSFEEDLTALLNTLCTDLAEDGTIDTPGIRHGLNLAKARLDSATILENLRRLASEETDSEVPLPNIERYLSQILIIWPADGSALAEAVTVKAAIPPALDVFTQKILVDGDPVGVIAPESHEWLWNVYYWSSLERHTLLVEVADDSGNAAFSNLVNVTVLPEANAVLQSESPADASVIRKSSRISLQWKPLSDAIVYELELAREQTFQNPFVQEHTEQSELTTEALSKDLYFWRFRAGNQYGKKGRWSEVNSFRVAGPDAPEGLSSEVESEGDPTHTVTLEWLAVDHAYRYEVEIAFDEDFQEMQDSFVVDERGVQLFLETGRFYWRVRAVNVDGIQGDWSHSEVINAGLFAASLGGVGSEYARDFVITHDGGYAVLGRTNSWGAGSTDIYLVRLDAWGEILWEKTYGGVWSDDAHSIEQTRDGGFILTGYMQDFVSRQYFPCVIKTDGDGEKEWRILEEENVRNFGNSYGDIQETDNGYLILGPNQWITKLDDSGALEWRKALTCEQETHYPESINPTSDGNFIVGGYYSRGVFLSKLNAQGEPFCNTRFLVKDDEFGAPQAIELGDGGYVLSGHGENNAQFYRVDVQGLLQKYVNLYPLYYGSNPANTSDGGFALLMQTTAGCRHSCPWYLLNFDTDAVEQWRHELPELTNLGSAGIRIRQHDEGGFVILGTHTESGEEHPDMILLRTDGNGRAIPLP